jgi:Cu(I)/Ag(I) efflux system membrane fusion protein
MKAKYAAVLVAVAAVAYIAGTWRAQAPAEASNGRRVLYYRDPMHPAYTSDKPGAAPDCGMKLEAVYAESAALAPTGPAGAEAATPAPSAPANAFRIDPEKQRLIGVRAVEVSRRRVTHRLRAPGRVAADESRIFRVTAKSEGWVREIFPPGTGALVKKGEPLVTVYGRDYRMAQQSYTFALNAVDRAKGTTGTFDAVEQVRFSVAETLGALQSMGVDAAQIEEIAKSRQPQLDTRLTAPVTGFITLRNVYPNQKFDAGMELYRVVDLTRVWVFADLFSDEARHISSGAAAAVTRAGIAQGGVTARVSDALPQFDGASRTLKLRLEADNASYTLRPDMLVNVEIPIALPEAIVIPADAVLDSGREQCVFVDRGGGWLERRTVRTGWHYGSDIEILRGLEPGEHIVSGATFLVDSESRLHAAR